MKKNNTGLFVEFIKSPLGILKIEATDTHLVSLTFSEGIADNGRGNQITQQAIVQLKDYFEGRRKKFDIPLHAAGTPFEQKVWYELQSIPFGTTSTYGTIAKKLDDVNSVRAVGRANGQNPIAILIPCHRVVGADNSLTGYSGGLERKEWLLRHEGALLI